ncbi:hypothetical protein ACIBBB_13250 [Streptomyces sp. NPDC051217]|uniref:hypothetical protein n=1 Tax=Streptomyces sp. NPDC051217 TaxID=3365644 RepID=UPI00379ADBD6
MIHRSAPGGRGHPATPVAMSVSENRKSAATSSRGPPRAAHVRGEERHQRGPGDELTGT